MRWGDVACCFAGLMCLVILLCGIVAAPLDGEILARAWLLFLGGMTVSACFDAALLCIDREGKERGLREKKD